MKRFKHYDACTLDEAVSLLKEFDGKANIIAGGTDIVGLFKDNVFAESPEALINIKTIPGLDYVQEEEDMLKIGPLALLEDLAHNKLLKSNYTALAEAARRTASPTSGKWVPLAAISVSFRDAGTTVCPITDSTVSEKAAKTVSLKREKTDIIQFLAMSRIVWRSIPAILPRP